MNKALIALILMLALILLGSIAVIDINGKGVSQTAEIAQPQVQNTAGNEPVQLSCAEFHATGQEGPCLDEAVPSSQGNDPVQEAKGETITYVLSSTVEAASSESDASDSIAGFYYPDMTMTYSMMSISADGTYAEIYFYRGKYTQDTGKWNKEENGTYHFVPDDEVMRELGEQWMKNPSPGILVGADMEDWRWSRQSLNPEFSGFAPLGEWTIDVGGSTDALTMNGDMSYTYRGQQSCEPGAIQSSKLGEATPTCIKRMKWSQSGNYIYTAGSDKPIIEIDGHSMFYLGHGGKIEMRRVTH